MENKEITQKLKVQDYVFEIDGENINSSVVTYTFYKTLLGLEISGVNNENKEAWIYFELEMNLNDLNKYSKVPTNISEYVSSSESFIKKPNYENSDFLDFDFPKNNFEDMHKNLSSVWISKIKENVFIFKVCIPNEGVFTFFIVDFNEN